MGLELTHVVSDERHHGPFLCCICQNLCGLDALVTSRCSHVFCRLCLETWLSSPTLSTHQYQQQTGPGQNQPTLMQAMPGAHGEEFWNTVPVHVARRAAERRCPTCNRDLSRQFTNGTSSSLAKSAYSTTKIGNQKIEVQPLIDMQPLAHRVLRSIKVSCPLLEKHGCPWKGDYGDLQNHLLSASAHIADTVASPPLSGGTKVKTLFNGNAAEDECDNNKFTGSSDMEIKQHGQDDSTDMDMDEQDNLNELLPHEHTNTEVSKRTLNGAHASIDVSSIHSLPSVLQHSQQQARAERRRALAESFKTEANSKFSTANYAESRDLYTKAISIMTVKDENMDLNVSLDDQVQDSKVLATLYSNRAATYLQLKEYEKCIEDCNNATALDPDYTKAYLRRSKAFVELGRFEEAFAAIMQAPRFSQVIQTEMTKMNRLQDQMLQGINQLRARQYAAAKSTFGTLLQVSNSARVLVGAARADLGLGLTDSALRLSTKAIRLNDNCAEGYEVRGHCMYLMGEFENGMTLLREALRLDPDSNGARLVLKECRLVFEDVKLARQAVFERNFDHALELFTTALHLCQESLPRKASLYCMLHTERGEALLRLKNYEAALKDCALAVDARDDFVSAWLVKAKALHGLDRDEEAFEELGSLMTKWGAGDDQVRKAYEKAEFYVRKKKRPNFYKIFGIPQIASEMEIKKAYKTKAMEYHPDRWSGTDFTDEQRKEAQRNFQLLGEGLEILSDAFQRQLYDEGYDQEAIRDRIAAAQQAAHGRRRGGGDYHH